MQYAFFLSEIIIYNIYNDADNRTPKLKYIPPDDILGTSDEKSLKLYFSFQNFS